MKYKVTVRVNQDPPTVMAEGVSASKAMNMVLSCLQTRLPGEIYDVRVEYLTSAGVWKLENSVKIK